MLVCICKSVNDEMIKNAIQSGARSVDKIRETTEACTQCKKCECQISQMIKKAGDDRLKSSSGIRPLAV